MQKRILVFDDNATILEVVREVLLYEDFEVAATSHLREFQLRLDIAPPNLILLDYKLGEYNGADICRTLKANAKTKNIPVIIFSAYINEHERFEECGCDAAIPKPFDMTGLMETVNQVLLKYAAH